LTGGGYVGFFVGCFTGADLAGAGAAFAGVVLVVFFWSAGAAVSAALKATASTRPAQNIFPTVLLKFMAASIGIVVRTFINQNERARTIPHALRKFLT
jgi:hypothetical protein